MCIDSQPSNIPSKRTVIFKFVTLITFSLDFRMTLFMWSLNPFFIPSMKKSNVSPYFENAPLMITTATSVTQPLTPTLASYFNVVPCFQPAVVFVPLPIHIFPVDLTDKCQTLPLSHTDILKSLHNLYIPGWETGEMTEENCTI